MKNSGKILVVDDDAGGRRLTRATLVRAGFDVIEAEDGEVAIDTLKTGMPDLVLMDVSMPRKDGFTACAELRKLPGGELVPVIMMTGLDDVQSIERAFEVGANDFITKPINWPLLPHRVRYMMRASDAINKLNENKRRLSDAQRIGEMGDWLWDVERNRIVLSEQAWRIFGKDAAQGAMNSSLLFDCIHPEDVVRVSAEFDSAIQHGKDFSTQHRILQSDSVVRHVHQQIEIVTRDDTGKTLQVAGAVHDVTQRTDAEEQIRRLAYYDTLTGLPNRLLYLKQLANALTYAAANGQKLAVMFIDLDNFKRVNDTLGHSAGDELLKVVSGRLVNSIRVVDAVMRNTSETEASPSIARLGGDEFTVMVSDIKSADDASIVARRLINALLEPVTLGSTVVHVSGSVGVALYPDDGTDIESLLKHADIAMYRAKEDGKGRFHFYDPSMTARAMSKMDAETQLRRALERNEFVLHFQPRVDVRSNRIVGAEALLRWQHPERGLMFPGHFIELCEEMKLIVPVGEWVLQQACAQQATWRDAGYGLVPLSINLSANHLREDGLPSLVAQTLAQHRLPTSALEIEVTESVMLTDPESSIRNAVSMAQTGIRFALDDFGIGYSSLSYLKRLPVSYLKIDKSFVRDITTDDSDAAIIGATIAMAHMLDMRVVAEGVERKEQLEYLRDRGCDEYQGFLYSPGVAANEFARLLVTSNQASPVTVRAQEPMLAMTPS